MKTFGGIILVVLVLAGLYFGYWLVAADSVDKRYGVNTNSQQYQSALVSQQRDRIAAYDVAVDGAQKTQIANTFCATYEELTRPPRDLVLANERLDCP